MLNFLCGHAVFCGSGVASVVLPLWSRSVLVGEVLRVLYFLCGHVVFCGSGVASVVLPLWSRSVLWVRCCECCTSYVVT